MKRRRRAVSLSQDLLKQIKTDKDGTTVKGVNDHGLGTNDWLRNGYGVSSNQNKGNIILTNMKIKSPCNGIFEVFEQIYNNRHDDNSNSSYHELDEGQCRSDLGIDFLRNLDPFRYFHWMVGARNLVRFLVKDEQQNHLNQQQQEGQLPNNSFKNVTNDGHGKKECHTKLKIKENFLKRAVDEKFKQIEQMIRFISVNKFDQQQIGNTNDYKRPLNGPLKSDESSTMENYSGINDLGEDRAGCNPRSEPDYRGVVQTTDKRPSKELDTIFARVDGPRSNKKKG
ncbi:hypothetical protein PPACK8108_LOCUS1107 [Phakopsora pachyrhizi]|uniref:Uncharacterized protein n=1 Tax=Phakopsora pachyrhizi TaxID=170000 RepID=A0AAV0AGX4_PHAPC|nr:hypothetical protein PPACK8108_LOCUS1107 [Phakopsora pachyrhizi]